MSVTQKQRLEHIERHLQVAAENLRDATSHLWQLHEEHENMDYYLTRYREIHQLACEVGIKEGNFSRLAFRTP